MIRSTIADISNHFMEISIITFQTLVTYDFARKGEIMDATILGLTIVPALLVLRREIRKKRGDLVEQVMRS